MTVKRKSSATPRPAGQPRPGARLHTGELVSVPETPTKPAAPRRYGLVGHPLGHSLSPFIHEGIMQALDIPGSYELFDIRPEQLADKLPELMALDGFNVTIPHKETLYRLLSEHDPACAVLGSVNTLHKGIGYNTDLPGFAETPIRYSDRHVLILGAGGTGRTMAFHAASEGAVSLTFLVRNPARTMDLLRDLQTVYPELELKVLTSRDLQTEIREGQAPYQLILNGTPLGMWPRTGELPLPERSYKQLLRSQQIEAVFDAIYNPTATRFILIARSHQVDAYGGSGMLYAQALAAQAIWQGQPATTSPADLTTDPEQLAALKQVRRDLNIAISRHSPIKWVITGFMGSGKTRMAKRLGNALPFDVAIYDLDKEIVRASGMSINDYFAEKGEADFRRFEREVLLDLLARDEAMVISTGGGTIVQRGCARAVHDANAMIIALQVSLKTALRRIGDGRTRPLARGPGARERVEQLYRERYPIYRATADYIVDANRYPQRVTQGILRAFDIPPRERPEQTHTKPPRSTRGPRSRRKKHTPSGRQKPRKHPKKEGSQ